MNRCVLLPNPSAADVPPHHREGREHLLVLLDAARQEDRVKRLAARHAPPWAACLGDHRNFKRVTHLHYPPRLPAQEHPIRAGAIRAAAARRGTRRGGCRRTAATAASITSAARGTSTPCASTTAAAVTATPGGFDGCESSKTGDVVADVDDDERVQLDGRIVGNRRVGPRRKGSGRARCGGRCRACHGDREDGTQRGMLRRGWAAKVSRVVRKTDQQATSVPCRVARPLKSTSDGQDFQVVSNLHPNWIYVGSRVILTDCPRVAAGRSRRVAAGRSYRNPVLTAERDSNSESRAQMEKEQCNFF